MRLTDVPPILRDRSTPAGIYRVKLLLPNLLADLNAEVDKDEASSSEKV